VPEPDEAEVADAALGVEDVSLHGRPSSEIRLRGRRSAVRGLVIGLLLAAAAAAVLAWAQFRVREEPHEVPLVKPAPEAEAVPPTAAVPEKLPAPQERPSAAKSQAESAAEVAEPGGAMPRAEAEGERAQAQSQPEVKSNAEKPREAKRAARVWKPRPKREPAKQPQAQVPQPKSKPNCDPYYYIDHEGIRRPKPECL
jgi:hypothetical protein